MELMITAGLIIIGGMLLTALMGVVFMKIFFSETTKWFKDIDKQVERQINKKE